MILLNLFMAMPPDVVECFFFSSRRRHTRFDCDWSSDVCSSDLPPGGLEGRIAGLAIGVFAVCNSAFIAMDGISTGIIVANAGGLPPDQQQPVVDAVQGLWHNHVVSALATAGALGWLVGIAAAAAALVGLRSARPPLLLLLASVALRVPSQLPGLDTTAAEIVMAASVVAALAAAAALYAGRRRLDQAGILLLLLLAALSPQHAGRL